MRSLRWGKQLDIRAFLVFQRIQRFYSTFVVLAALISGLAVAALTFSEFHPTSSGLIQTSEGFLCSSAITAVISAVVATMLLFQFEGLEKATRRDLAVAWAPLVLLDLSILEFLLGMVCWYSGKSAYWRGALMATQFAFLMVVCFTLSIWMWFYMSKRGGLGKEETQAAATHERVADK
jgi:ABC-type xylose transport system permease subunit